MKNFFVLVLDIYGDSFLRFGDSFVPVPRMIEILGKKSIFPIPQKNNKDSNFENYYPYVSFSKIT